MKFRGFVRCSFPLIIAVFMVALLVGLGHTPHVQANSASTPTPASTLTPVNAPPPDFADTEPLPGGCKGGLPPGEDEPVCCISGMVVKETVPVSGAAVSIQDAQGEIGVVYTRPSPLPNEPPKYFVDLTKLRIRLPSGTRAITPTDVITLVASYSGVTGKPVRYVVQPGGQQRNFNPYDQNVMALNVANPGVAEPGKFNQIIATALYSDVHLLYLWDGGNHRMQVLQLDGSGIWRNFPKWQRTVGTQPNQVLDVQAIALDPKNGRVYLADSTGSANQGIKVYTLDGEFTGKVIPSHGTFGDGNGGSMGTDAAGNLYVSMNDGIYKYDANGNQIAYTPLGVDKAGRPIAVAPNGNFYLVNNTPNGIFKFGSDLQPQPYPLQLTAGLVISHPTMITVDDQNTVFVFDHGHFRPYAFDATTGQQLPYDWPSPNFSAGSTVYLAPHGDSLYLISMFNGQIIQLPRLGVPTGATPTFPTWGGITSNGESIELPFDIVAARDRSIFYISPWAGRIGRMVDQKVQQSWKIWPPGSAYTGAALTIDSADNLLVSDGGRIQRFHYDFVQETLVTETVPWDGSNSKLGKLVQVRGLAADRSGYVYVADPGKHQVGVVQQIAGTNGFTAVTSISISGVLSQPLGIVVNDQVKPTQLYVSSDGGYIVRLSFDGTQLTYLDRFGPFTGAAHLALGDGGFLWVAAQSAVYKVALGNPNDSTKWLKFRNTQDANDPNWNAYGIAITKTIDGKNDLLTVSSPHYGFISSFKPMAESDPVATIVHLSDGDLMAGDMLTMTIAGQDGHKSNQIVGYEVSTTDEISPNINLSITTQQTLVLIPTIAGANQWDKLGIGLHHVRVRVQDLDGAWSQPVSTTVYVAPKRAVAFPIPSPTPDPQKTPPPLPTTCDGGWKWTMFLYLDADNTRDGAALLGAYREALAKLGQVDHACVQAAVQLDGPGNGDTERWLIQPDLNGSQPKVTPGWFEQDGKYKTTIESAMDDPAELSDFIRWGAIHLPKTDYYMLILSNHGNGYQGIAFDESSREGLGWNKYLKASGIRTALKTAGVHIDIVYLDACSMALLDVAYELRDTKVEYLVASQYIDWSLFAYADYARFITLQSTPAQVARMIVERYAYSATRQLLPYTLSAINLSRIEAIKNGIQDLAKALRGWLAVDLPSRKHHSLLFDIRNQSQFFDSNTNYRNTPRDAYVDLKDFVTRVQQAGLNGEITDAATNVLSELEREDGLILWSSSSGSVNLPNRYAGGDEITLTRASGISLYYPAEGSDLLSLPPDTETMSVRAASAVISYTERYATYVTLPEVDFARAAGWGEFLEVAYGTPPADPSLLATPLPPLAPVEIPMTSTPTATPSATPTATPTPTIEMPSPMPTIDPTLVAVVQTYQPTGNVAHFQTTITNQNAITLSNIVLKEIITPTLEIKASLSDPACQESNFTKCIAMPNIAPNSITTVPPFDMPIPSDVPFAPQAILLSNGAAIGKPSPATRADEQIYLPLIRK